MNIELRWTWMRLLVSIKAFSFMGSQTKNQRLFSKQSTIPQRFIKVAYSGTEDGHHTNRGGEVPLITRESNYE